MIAQAKRYIKPTYKFRLKANEFYIAYSAYKLYNYVKKIKARNIMSGTEKNAYTPDNGTWQKDAKIISGEVSIMKEEEVPVSARLPYLTQDKTGVKELSLTCGGCKGLFLRGESVDFILRAPSNDGKIKYRVRNTLNGETFKGELQIDKSCDKFLLNFTPCDICAGHYRLSVYIKGNALHTYFAVVHTISNRPADSPFGLDHASAWHVEEKDREDYALLVARSGVSWVRERIRLNDVCKPDGYHFENYDHAYSLLKKHGLKISVCFHDMPQHFNTDGWMGDSLVMVRKMAKDIAAHFDGVVDAWEIWNEQDVTHFSGGTPDEFAAFTKAFALGIADSGAKTLRALGSYARVPKHSDYGRCMMNNDIMSYVDIYNFHTYVFPAKNAAPSPDVDAITKHMANSAENGNKCAWLTETGAIITRPEDQGTLLKNYQCARYTSLVGALACYYGVDKSFSFMLPGYYEGGVGFGMMSDSQTILPEYTALASLCYNLGEGRVLGKTTLEVEGFAVDCGEDQVLMLWSDEPKSITLPVYLPTVISDMNGCERCFVPQANGLELTVGAAPIYVHFNKIPENLYSNDASRVIKPEPQSILQSDRCFIKPVFKRDNFPYFPNPHIGEGEILKSGYRLCGDKPTEFTLKCCNFTDKAVSMSICYKAGDGVTLIAPDAVTVNAMQEADVPASIAYSGEGSSDIYIWPLVNGEKGSVAYFTLENKEN